MAQQKTFLNKLAHFVSNPTTDWSAIEATKKNVQTSPEEFLVGDKGVIDPAKLRLLQRERRKRNYRIRQKEFDMLRKIQVSARIPGVADMALNSQSLVDEDEMLSSIVTNLPMPPSKGNFDIDKIDAIERQMASQWWSKKTERIQTSLPPAQERLDQRKSDSEQTGKLQKGLPPAAVEDVRQSADVDAISHEQLESISWQPENADLPHAVSDAGESLGSSAHVDSGHGDKIAFEAQEDISDPQDEFSATFFEEDTLSDKDLQDEEIYIPLFTEDKYLLAENEELDATLQQVLEAQETEQAFVPSSDSVGTLPEALNDPAVAFARGRDDEAQSKLRLLVDDSIARVEKNEKVEPDALLALLDFYRATRQEDEFENLSIELVRYFERSAPQYHGADRIQASVLMTLLAGRAPVQSDEQGSWRSPEKLDLNDVMLLRSQLVLYKPVQVLLDWRSLETILDDAIEPLLDQFRDLSGRKIEILMWGADHLLACCKKQIDSGTYSPAVAKLLWLLRLEVARIVHAQQEFDELALEYCMALEQSPPSWVPPRCLFIDVESAMGLVDGDAMNAHSTDNNLHPYQWDGNLTGNIDALLQSVEAENARGNACVIDCMQLDRMDYAAATVLNSWLDTRDAKQGEVRFINVHRLLGALWRVVGITSKARVDLRSD